MLPRLFQKYIKAFSGLRREVWYLAIVLLINRSGAMVIPFLTVYLTAERGFTLGEAGLVMSSFGAGSLVGSYVGGYLTDRIGFYPIQQITLAGSGLLFILLGQMDRLWPLCVVTFLLSLVADAFRPANQAAVAYYSRPENLARSYGLLRLAVNLGFSLGPVLGGLLIATLGYPWLFIVDGVTCMLAALAFRLLLPPGRQREPEVAETAESRSMVTLSAYRDRNYIVFVLCVVLSFTAFMQFFSSLPIYLKQHLGYTESEIGGLIALNGLLIVLVEMQLVHLAGERFRIMGIIAVGTALLGISHLFLVGAGLGLIMPLLYILTLTLGEILSMPFTSTFAAERAPANRRGQYMGLLSIGYAISFIAAPSLGLWWADRFGFTSLWWLAIVLSAAAVAGLLWLYRQDERGQASRQKAEPAPAQAAA